MDSKYIEEFEHLDQDQKSQMLINMKQFISQLQLQIQDLEKSAIDIIMEKDEKIAQLEALLNQNVGQRQYNKDDEILQLKGHINELNTRMDAIQMKHFEQLQDQERMWNSYMLDQIQQSSQDGQQEKFEMLETLHYLEEKVYKLDRDLEMKENQQMFDRNTINQLANINQQLLDESQELNQQLIKMQRQMDLLKEHFDSEKNTYEIKLNVSINLFQKQNISLSSLQRQISTLKIQNQKLCQTNKDLQTQTTELRDQLETQLEKRDKVHSENYQLQQTANSTDQYYREEINITAFELLEESYEDKDKLSDIRKMLDEKSELLLQYEECIKQSTKQIKEQRAQLQLLQNQLKLIRKQQFNQKNLKEYVQTLESDFLVSKQLLSEKADTYQEQVIQLSRENYNLKQKIKCFQTRVHKKLN